MPLDLQVPKRFPAVPEYRQLGADAPFSDEIRLPIPCNDPEIGVVPICLDTDQLRVGDVFLFHRSLKRSLAIELYQSKFCGLSPRASRITHVAVYTGRGMIWDHNPGKNVRMRTVSSALEPGTVISVSRPKTDQIDKQRLLQQCAHLQAQANYKLQSAVNWKALMERATVLRFPTEIQVEMPQALVCSTFVATALDYATLSRFTFSHGVILPGDFVQSALFEGLDIEWSCMAR